MRMSTNVGCICLLGSLIACDPAPEATEIHNWIVTNDQGAIVPVDFVNPVVATIDTKIEGKIEFLDEALVGGFGIGVVAIGIEGGRALALLDAEGASPLEVFLALAPADAAPPEALLVDHQALANAGEVDAEPRVLLSLRETYYERICWGPPNAFDGFNTFWNSWSSGYGATNNSTTLTSIGFNITTGASSSRSLASCIDSGTATMTIQRESPSLLTWGTIYHQGGVPTRHGVAYRSSTVEVTRYREIAATSSPQLFYAAVSY